MGGDSVKPPVFLLRKILTTAARSRNDTSVIGGLTGIIFSLILLLFTISIIIRNNKMEQIMSDLTISQAISAYLDSVQLARSQNTARTYKNALTIFQRVLKEFWLDPETSPAEKLTEDAITWLATYLKNFSAPTERLYLTAVAGFYEYVAAERLADINLPRLRLLIRQRARRPGIRLPQFPSENIERMLDFAQQLLNKCSKANKLSYAH